MNVLFCFFLLSLSLSVKAVIFETGHREAMLANGGSTNICSPGQFIKNPAGVYCPEATPKTEAFAASGLSWLQYDVLGSSGYQDMQSGSGRISPGLSLFSQGFHQEDMVWGFWASLQQNEVQKNLSLTNSLIYGTAEYTIRQNETALGPFYSTKYKNIYLGAAVYFLQRETQTYQTNKFNTSGAYYLQTDSNTTAEQLVGVRFGATLDLSASKYSVILKPRSHSIHGSVRKDFNTAGTNNTFTEDTKNGRVKTSDPLVFQFGSEFNLKLGEKLFLDADWKSTEHVDFDIYQQNPTAESYSVSMGYERLWSDRLSVLCGTRIRRSVNESNETEKNQSVLVTLGLVRKFKTVELGTVLGYGSQTSKTYGSASASYQNSSKFTAIDIAFSSTYSY